MILPRRHFLGASLVALGGTLIDALATPIWKLRSPIVIEAASDHSESSPVQYFDDSE